MILNDLFDLSGKQGRSAGGAFGSGPRGGARAASGTASGQEGEVFRNGSSWLDQLPRLTASRLRTLAQAARDLLTTSERATAYSKALDLLLESLGAERGVLLLWERERNRFHKIASRPWADFPELDLSFIQEMGEAVLKSGAGRIHAPAKGPARSLATCLETSTASRLGAGQFFSRVAALCAPLLSRTEPLGILYLDASQRFRQFGPDDLEFACLYGWVAGNCLESAKLFAEVVTCHRDLAARLFEQAGPAGRLDPSRQPSGPLAHVETFSLILGGLHHSLASLSAEIGKLASVLDDLTALSRLGGQAEAIRRRIAGLRLLTTPPEDNPGQSVKLFELMEVALTSLGWNTPPRIHWPPTSPEIRIQTGSVAAARWILARMLEAASGEASGQPGVEARIHHDQVNQVILFELQCPGLLPELAEDLALGRLIALEILDGDLQWEDQGRSTLLRLRLPVAERPSPKKAGKTAVTLRFDPEWGLKLD
ncbi:MAG: GAF domain-containing protein [Planctomycetes bacterium]|nr:GAF domain-containing protein [Planctomycetota bacterium]